MTPLWEVWIPGWHPPGLNGSRGLIRMHFRAKRKAATETEMRLRSCGHPLPSIEEPVRVEFERRVARRQHLMDWDNAAASFKLVGDALVHLEVLPDDSPRWIAEFHPSQRVVRSESLAGTRVAIYRTAARTEAA